MERRRVIEVTIAAAVLLALMFVVWFITRDTAEEQVVEEEKTQTLPATNTTEKPTTINPADVPQVQEVSAGTIARTFVERIGSYSSESDYQNVADVSRIVTAELAAKLEEDAEDARAQSPDNGGYYGISTSYVGAKNIEESEAAITLLVQTQREESFGSPGNSTVRYQTVEVTLIKEGKNWKVSEYTWGD
ncbi:MAG: hypothetical protein AAB448_00030 [Patescibacteria group bacterium]